MKRASLKTLVSLLLVAVCWDAVAAQDVDYIRAMERAQQQRPATIGHSSRIAVPDEPGIPMVLHGRIVNPDGTPAAGAIVFAYQTDRTGLYDRREAGAHSWRLKGWARADADGRFTFETIRPGPYPGRRTPAHVHFTAFTPAGERYHAGEVRFDDDPLVAQQDRDASAQALEFGEVRPVRQEGDVQHVDFTLRIDVAQRF